ncbi:choice-of-anchor I family protein [Agromyces aerolatus]|uniref:choice-of-anchor I family protein n=1 Tax=Agromyces sp. LY-1074 TaxID=3074080 RepID=UPI002863DCC5|nr:MULTISPECIES: choice-of-anchor I family protein [unclassified Agromyces]MDR5698658.1 choice-of-anchor I family protein [Agromyces sp. LY-1074]MDR5704952.1 choice-of-anchor I family protein [Agromyces sp. LY-1358]
MLPSRPFFRRAAVPLVLSAALAAGCLATAPAAALTGPIRTATAPIADAPEVSAEGAALSLRTVGTYESGIFDRSAAEIVAYYGERLYVVNALAGLIDVLDVSDPAVPVRVGELAGDGVANSLAVRADGLGVVALEDREDKTAPGRLMFFDATAASPVSLGTVVVGSLPDMVAISADGTRAVVANEGEPAGDFSSDPEGSVGIVELPSTVAAPEQSAVRTADFHEFEEGGSKTLHPDVRVFGPTPEADLPVSRNLEPEYVTIDGDVAYAALQEANAIAVVDLVDATVTDILPLGFVDHSAEGHGIDASDRDGGFDIRTFPGLKGMYLPDGMQSYQAGGETYLVTANEGDAREWGEYVEPARVKDLGDDDLAPVCATSPAAGLLGDADLGRLNVSTAMGLSADGSCYEELYSFGSRSFSIWGTDGSLVFDSGEAFERITHEAAPEFFNSNHSESNFEGRSDDKGPEPENLAIGEVDGRTYAFIGFERVGGIAVFDITTPTESAFVTYLNYRDFDVSVEDDGEAQLSAAGDLGPEGITFIPAATSPTGEPMLAVGNEVSGTTTILAVDVATPETVQLLSINDFHGRLEQDLGGGLPGAAVLAGAVDQLRDENRHTVFASAGDNIGASTFTSFSQEDQPTIDALMAMGLDVSSVGNHEFDQGYRDLIDRVIPAYGDAGLALGANVYLKGTDTPALDEFKIVETGGVKIGYIGVVTEQTDSLVAPDGIAEIEFGSQLEAVNRVAAQLRDGDAQNGEADVVVLLAHDGSEETSCDVIANEDSVYGELVREASADIDAIFSGHTHKNVACEFPVDGAAFDRPVVSAGEYAKHVARIQLAIDPETKRATAATVDTLPLLVDGVAQYPADAGVQAIVDAAVAAADVVGAVEIGSITGDILRGGEPAGADRGVESSLGNLVADQQLWATSSANDAFAGTPSQIAFMNPGGLRADLLYGEDGTVTYKDVASTQPFGNTLFQMDLTGAQIEQALEEQWQPDGSSRPKLHLGVSEGFGYVYEPDAARGEHIVSMSLQGEEIEASDVFRVTVNSFLAPGGDNFGAFAEGTNRADSGQIDLVAAVSYFEEFVTVAPAPLGRAVVARTDWADVSLSSSTVRQGGSFEVSVTGLEPGQQISATLFSEPLVIEGIPVASAEGATSFTVRVPADFVVGAHTLIVESAGHEPIAAAVTVTAAAGGGGAGGGAGSGLASTGADVLPGLVLAALLAAAGALFVIRRRRGAATND